MTDREPEVTRRKIPIRDPWVRSRIVGNTDVSSGPLPTSEELPPVEPQEKEVEKIPSPMYPTNKPPRRDVPQGGVPRGDRD